MNLLVELEGGPGGIYGHGDGPHGGHRLLQVLHHTQFMFELSPYHPLANVPSIYEPSQYGRTPYDPSLVDSLTYHLLAAVRLEYVPSQYDPKRCIRSSKHPPACVLSQYVLLP